MGVATYNQKPINPKRKLKTLQKLVKTGFRLLLTSVQMEIGP